MGIDIVNTAGGTAYASPIVGGPRDVTNLKLDVSTLTTAEVDAYGYVKPGVILRSDGTLVSGSSQIAYGVVIEAYKLPGRTSNSTPALSGDTSDPLIAVSTLALINRDIAEDNLGRAYTANELAAIAAAGSRLGITTT